ncbi:hypothetical protein GQ44DRAFT_767884 [Phaeosphaeriaceae sp. PMI808]|nr:hypothetical protein GQ44DRAFT_767884 [Phaeosphaeriaceae sp. PMI808]
MTPSSTLQSQPVTKNGRRSRRAGTAEERSEKPKKANSEVRKQQNRIASRNYREKRKRKLQYLQNLIQEGSKDEQTPEPSPQLSKTFTRSLSAEYQAGSSLSPFTLPSNGDFATNLTRTEVLQPRPDTSGASFESHLHPPSRPYPPFETSWDSLMYDPLPPVNMNYIPTWISSVDCLSQVGTRPESVHFSSEPAQVGFEQVPTLYNHSRGFAPHAEQCVFTSPYENYRTSQNYASSIPSVSLHTSSSYLHKQYSGPHQEITLLCSVSPMITSNRPVEPFTPKD